MISSRACVLFIAIFTTSCRNGYVTEPEPAPTTSANDSTSISPTAAFTSGSALSSTTEGVTSTSLQASESTNWQQSGPGSTSSSTGLVSPTSGTGHSITEEFSTEDIGPKCGDGSVDQEIGEQCEGNYQCDQCHNTCGNGAYEPEFSEQCDGGPFCSSFCTFTCGNGILEENEECDESFLFNSDLATDFCSTACKRNGRIAFVSDLEHSGDYDGLHNAHALCSSMALTIPEISHQMNDSKSNFRAWLSKRKPDGDEITPSDDTELDIANCKKPYFQAYKIGFPYLHRKILNSLSDLVGSPTLNEPIRISEKGNVIEDDVLTASNGDGKSSISNNNDCFDWYNGINANHEITYGNSSSKDPSWSNKAMNGTCATAYHLYCFEECW